MNRLWQIILGIERPPGRSRPAPSRLEFSALPQGATAAALVIRRRSAFLGIALVALPPRRPRPLAAQARAAGRPAGAHCPGARGHAGRAGPDLAARDDQVAPGDHPRRFREHEVFRPVHRRVARGRDRVELKLESAGGRSPVERLRETPRLDLVKTRSKPTPGGTCARAASSSSTTWNRRRGRAPASRRGSGRSTTSSPTAPISPLGDALHGVLAAHRGQPVAGLVIATDGRSNTGEEPLRADRGRRPAEHPDLRDRRRAAEGPRNVRLAEIEVSPVVFVRDPMTLAVVVEARGLRDAEATLILEQRINEGDWEPVANQRVVLGEDGILKRTTFRITPKVVGQYEFRARVEDAGPELTLEDNVATAAVKVVRQQIRVLLIAGAPSPEVQFLRNALMRDQHVEFAGWIQHADPGFRQPGDRPISRLPNDTAELRNYDALLLVDPDLRALRAAMAGDDHPLRRPGRRGADLRRGRALLAAAFRGRRSQGRRRRTGREILPIVRDPGLFRTEAEVRLSSQSTYALELTPEGRGDPDLRVQRRPDPEPGDPDQPARDVLEFPGHPLPTRGDGAGAARRPADAEPVRPAGPAGLAALRTGPHGVHRIRQHLSLALSLRGLLRRVLGAAGRPRRPEQGARRAVSVPGASGKERLPGRRSGVDRSSLHRPSRRSPKRPSWRPSSRSPASRRSRSGSRKRPTIPSLLTATFPAGQAGAYSLRIVPTTAATAGSDIRASTTTFRVEPPKREIDEPSLNRPLLAELARLTHGRVFEVADVRRA